MDESGQAVMFWKPVMYTASLQALENDKEEVSLNKFEK